MTAAVLSQFFLLPSEMLRCVFLLIADLGKYQVNRPNRIHTGKAGVESNTHALVDRRENTANFPSSRFPRYSFKKAISPSHISESALPTSSNIPPFRVNYLIGVNTKILKSLTTSYIYLSRRVR